MVLLVAFLCGLEATIAEPVVYKVAADQSRMTVHVGAAGLFKMLGHEHTIAVPGLSGTVSWDGQSPESSRFLLGIDAASLSVADEELSEEDRAQVQADMEAKALALPQNPKIEFASTDVRVEKVTGARLQLRIRGTLSLRGVSKPLEVPLTVEVTEERVTARGEMELESKNWGVPQISAVGGAVKTKQDLGIAFEIVAVRE